MAKREREREREKDGSQISSAAIFIDSFSLLSSDDIALGWRSPDLGCRRTNAEGETQGEVKCSPCPYYSFDCSFVRRIFNKQNIEVFCVSRLNPSENRSSRNTWISSLDKYRWVCRRERSIRQGFPFLSLQRYESDHWQGTDRCQTTWIPLMIWHSINMRIFMMNGSFIRDISTIVLVKLKYSIWIVVNERLFSLLRSVWSRTWVSLILVTNVTVVLAKIPTRDQKETMAIYLYQDRTRKPFRFFTLNEYQRYLFWRVDGLSSSSLRSLDTEWLTLKLLQDDLKNIDLNLWPITHRIREISVESWPFSVS